METLAEFVQGPCPSNQEVLAVSMRVCETIRPLLEFVLALHVHGRPRPRDKAGVICAVAFANLSYEVTVQRMMVESGVVPIIAELSNSYSEDNQTYCARALCNLGCHFGSEVKIVEQGGVSSLMMICMVRAV